jgi:hypothetical protein
LIDTLFITVIIESLIVLGYSLWHRKPALPVLFTSICINLLTQSLLWIGLNLFFRYYLVALSIAEVLIWGLESVLLYVVPANELRWKDAILLSLSMNLASFALGWFLPV